MSEKYPLSVDMKSEENGRVSMSRYTFGLLHGILYTRFRCGSYPDLSDEFSRVASEAYDQPGRQKKS